MLAYHISPPFWPAEGAKVIHDFKVQSHTELPLWCRGCRHRSSRGSWASWAAPRSRTATTSACWPDRPPPPPPAAAAAALWLLPQYHRRTRRTQFTTPQHPSRTVTAVRGPGWWLAQKDLQAAAPLLVSRLAAILPASRSPTPPGSSSMTADFWTVIRDRICCCRSIRNSLLTIRIHRTLSKLQRLSMCSNCLGISLRAPRILFRGHCAGIWNPSFRRQTPCTRRYSSGCSWCSRGSVPMEDPKTHMMCAFHPLSLYYSR